jgi:hypothetical protein
MSEPAEKDNVRGGAAVKPVYIGAADRDRGIGFPDQERARETTRN